MEQPTKSDEELAELDVLAERYRAIMHAVQTGVGVKMAYDPDDTSPKHLRVGVNSALIESGALLRLLVARGVFTEIEYYRMLIAVAEDEVKMYENYLAEKTGRAIKLL